MEDSQGRGGAVRSLGEIGDPIAVDPLIDILEGDHDRGVRVEAAMALGKIGDPRAFDRLSYLASKDGNEQVKAAVELALAGIRT